MQNNPTRGIIDEMESVNNDVGGDDQIPSPVTKKKSDDDSLIEVLKKSILLRENHDMKQEFDADRLFMLSLLDDFRKIPEHRKLSTKMELLDIIKRAQNLTLEINNQSYSHSVPRILAVNPYSHKYGPEASNNIGQCHHEYSTQQNYGPGASSSGNHCHALATLISNN